MNHRERFLMTLTGKGIPDRVPLFEVHWGVPFIKDVLGPGICPYHNVDDEVRMSKATGIDMVWSAPLGFTAFTNIQQHGDRFQDEWGTWWAANEDSWPSAWSEGDAVNSKEDWLKLKMPDPDLPVRMEQPRRAVELSNREFAVIGAVRGPFSAVWMLAGLVNICMWIYDDPEFLEDLFREMSRWNTQLGLNLIRSGVDAIMIHDDWGMNSSTFIKPEHWKQYVWPYIAEEVETFANTGTPVIMHSDGNLNAILPEIVQMKISALNPLQRGAGMNLRAVKERYGDRITLIGNLGASTTLSFGTADDVEREALECVRDAGPGGRYILAPDHSYHGAIPNENIWRALDTCKKYGQYPLDMDAIEARLEELNGQK